MVTDPSTNRAQRRLTSLIETNALLLRVFPKLCRMARCSIVHKTESHLITGQPKHWLSSKMPALNYSVTHRIRHSCSYCTANVWLEDEEQQFFYNGIRAMEKCWTKCISVARVYVEKWCVYLVVNCVSLRTFWTPLIPLIVYMFAWWIKVLKELSVTR